MITLIRNKICKNSIFLKKFNINENNMPGVTNHRVVRIFILCKLSTSL